MCYPILSAWKAHNQVVATTISQSGDMADVFHFRFSTKYYDDDTGLYYYGYRYYSPMLQRWINRDPIGENGGLNLYGFVYNTPTCLVDKDGRIIPAVLIGAIIAWYFSTDTANAPGVDDQTYSSTGIADLIAIQAGGKIIGYFGGIVIKAVVKCAKPLVGTISITGVSRASINAAKKGKTSSLQATSAPLTGYLDKNALELAASSGGSKIRVYTSQSGALSTRKALSVSVENVELAKAAGADRILYEAELPRTLIEELIKQDLVRETTTFMAGVTAKELRFRPEALVYVLDFFKVVN